VIDDGFHGDARSTGSRGEGSWKSARVLKHARRDSKWGVFQKNKNPAGRSPRGF
jgi:hypothetical protein